MNPKKCIPARAFTIGLIYIKPLELTAITVMLDEEYESIPIQSGDDNEYILGRIGKHNVAIVGPPRGAQGTVAIGHVVSRIPRTFERMALGLLVGTGGGVPHLPEADVRLGDVVVGAPESGPAVVQYDLGTQLPGGFQVTRTLDKPPPLLLQVVNRVDDKCLRQRDDEDSFFDSHLARFSKNRRLRGKYARPTTADRLFSNQYRHRAGSSCSEHDKQYEKERKPRDSGDEIQIHYSTILSGGSVMKAEAIRDKLSARYNNALCFETEAAGLMDVFPCLIVRGICDYADTHKNDEWQAYAAATAAAYAREILLTMAERTSQDGTNLQNDRREDAPTTGSREQSTSISVGLGRTELAGALAESGDDLTASIDKNSGLSVRLGAIARFNMAMKAYIGTSPSYQLEGDQGARDVVNMLDALQADARSTASDNQLSGRRSPYVNAGKWQLMQMALRSNVDRILAMRRNESRDSSQQELEKVFGRFRPDDLSKNVMDMPYP